MRNELNYSKRRPRRMNRDPGITSADPSLVFDLGRSARCDVAKNKRATIAEASAARNKGRRGST
jgi:hypothetical protein